MGDRAPFHAGSPYEPPDSHPRSCSKFVIRWAILTGEYPPQPGGVSDYTKLVADGLANCGDDVSIFAPRCSDRESTSESRVVVNRLPDHFGPRSLLALDHALSELRPDRILIQYVPHAFGWKALNLPFAGWVAHRAKRIAPVWVMFHEVMTTGNQNRPVRAKILRHGTGAMARLVAGAAQRIFVSIPGWRRIIAQVCRGAKESDWLPIPCVVPSEATSQSIARIRERFAPGDDQILLGHFGTFGALITDLLTPVCARVLQENENTRLLLIGRGSADYCNRFRAAYPMLANRVAAAGELAAADVPVYIRACDAILQPYPDGISSRRTTVMAGMAIGVNIVSNLGALSEELWSDEVGVTLAPRPDSALLALKTTEFLQLPPLVRAERARQASEFYSRTFALEHTITKLRCPTVRC